MASLQIDRPQQHSQLGAMGVAEPKTKKAHHIGEPCSWCRWPVRTRLTPSRTISAGLVGASAAICHSAMAFIYINEKAQRNGRALCATPQQRAGMTGWG